jgi:hypothetical protein
MAALAGAGVVRPSCAFFSALSSSSWVIRTVVSNLRNAPLALIAIAMLALVEVASGEALISPLRTEAPDGARTSSRLDGARNEAYLRGTRRGCASWRPKSYARCRSRQQPIRATHGVRLQLIDASQV